MQSQKIGVNVIGNVKQRNSPNRGDKHHSDPRQSQMHQVREREAGVTGPHGQCGNSHDVEESERQARAAASRTS